MIVLTGGILGYLVYQQREILLSYHWQIHWLPLVGTFVLHAAVLLLGAFVWASIINIVSVQMPFMQHFKMFCMNMVARRVPGTIWHVVYRAQAYNRFGLNLKITSLSSGIELAVLILSGVISIILFAYPLLAKFGISYWVLVILVIIALAFLNPAFLKWIIKKSSADSSRIKFKDLLKWIAIYILLWIGGGGITFLFINVFYYLPIQQLGFVIGCWALVGTIAQAMVLLPSNFGFNEVSLSLLLSQVMPSSLAVVVLISQRIVLTFFEIFWSVLSLLLLKDKK